ncbi:MAG TPA: O-antigen ligase family protein, partial [Candidatus Udaeobacter sp.]|nr:O-antigen ligase family protein [Candidatus Udaeobacter sp.]
ALSLLQIYLALTGIFEHYRIKWLVFPPDILDPKAGEGRWYGVRARGPYLHSPIYGAAMGMGFFLLLHYFNTVKSKFKWLMVIGLLATPLACFYTLTRQVWIGLALPMLFGAFFSKRQRMMLVVLALAAAALLVTVKPADIIDPEVAKKRAGDEATGQARIAHYVIGFHMFLDRPIFGFGLQMWDASWENYRMRTTNFKSMFGTIDMNLARKVHAHNTFLRIAVELGLVGLIPFLAIFVLIFRASLHLYRHSHPNGLYGRELTLAYWQMAIAFLVCVSFVDPSMDEFLHGYFLTVTALIIRRSELVEQPAAALAAGMTFGSRA